MEGVPCFIEDCENFYDVNTEDYVGEQGTITKYLLYDTDEGCWMVRVEMGDGEILEVLECELRNYALLSNKKPSKPASKPIVKADKVVPVRAGYVAARDPYPYSWAQVKQGKSSTKSSTLNGVKIFNLTPKKKKYKSIFQSQ